MQEEISSVTSRFIKVLANSVPLLSYLNNAEPIELKILPFDPGCSKLLTTFFYKLTWNNLPPLDWGLDDAPKGKNRMNSFTGFSYVFLIDIVQCNILPNTSVVLYVGVQYFLPAAHRAHLPTHLINLRQYWVRLLPILIALHEH